MATDRAGARSPQQLQNGKSRGASRCRSSRFTPIDISALISSSPDLILRRKVREIVNVSGRGVRGHFPSYKGRLLKYESLVEEDTLRIMEIAGLVKRIITQPCVLRLDGDDTGFRYTPDALAAIGDLEYFVEVKAAGFAKNRRTVDHLRHLIAHVRRKKLPFILITEDDIRADGLQEELKLLLRSRPAPGRYDPDIDSSNWDPRNLQAADPELMQRWRQAQEVCDALIARVMRRDPDSLLETLSN